MKAQAARKRLSAHWSQRATEHSNALDLQSDVFALDDPKKIARSLVRSARRSKRRKTSPYRSAMSMLTFYINRAGRNLPARRRRALESAKGELRALAHRRRTSSSARGKAHK